MRQKFVIPGRFVSLNEFYRMNPYEQAREKRQSDEAVYWSIKQARIRPRNNPIRYHVLWVEQNRKRDLDNIAFGKKFIQDGMVKAGIIKNDSHTYIKGFSDSFAYDPLNPRIEVEIEDAN